MLTQGRPPRPSMVDVGRAANVSAQTVSRYFTGSGYVSKEARLRIAGAIDALGYVPSRAARSLRATRTDTIGVLTVGAFNYGSSGVLTGIGRAAHGAHVSVNIAQLDLPDAASTGWEAEAQRSLAQFESMRVDGLILSSPVPGFEQHLEGWHAASPGVVVSAPVRGPASL
jgi:DNA-binding LacI/PurR family transcriptional regulator